MTATTITTTSLSVAGTNLTDATYDTVPSGAGNGINFVYDRTNILVLKNGTGGSLTFTLKLKTFNELTPYSVTPTDPTIVVAAGKIYLIKLDDVLQKSDGYAYVECSGTGSALLLSV